jgi:hypothetical protein
MTRCQVGADALRSLREAADKENILARQCEERTKIPDLLQMRI